MKKKKLMRSNRGMIAGICAGIADYLDLDPTVVRVVCALLILFTAFMGVIAYFILWIIIPKRIF